MSTIRSTALTSDQAGVAPITVPSVSVVIPTHARPELVRRAIQSVLDQDYDGPMEVFVVFDRTEPDRTLERLDDERPVMVMGNERTPGLAGSRNTGIVASSADLIAFCDDDDVWLPTKLTTQVAALEAAPGAEFVTTAMTVDYQGKRSVRLAGRDHVDHTALLRSRMAMLHSSSFLSWTAWPCSTRIGTRRRDPAAQHGRGLGPPATRLARGVRSCTWTSRSSRSRGVDPPTSPSSGQTATPRACGCSSGTRRSSAIAQEPR